MKKISFFVLIALLFTGTAFAAVFVNDNFDSYANIEAVDEVWRTIGSSVSLVSPGYGGTGNAIQWVYNGGGTSPYEFDRFIPTNSSSTLYVQARVKVSSSPSGACKGIKMFGGDFSSDTGVYANTTFNFDFEDCITVICHGNGDSLANDTALCYPFHTLYWDASQDGLVETVTSDDFMPDTDWFTIKVYMKYNTNGNRDGETKVWINGVLRRHVTNIKNRNDGNVAYVERVAFGDYGNPSANFTMLMDDIVISDTDIDASEDECDADHLELCTTQEICEAASLNWCDGACQVAACSATTTGTVMTGVSSVVTAP